MISQLPLHNIFGECKNVQQNFKEHLQNFYKKKEDKKIPELDRFVFKFLKDARKQNPTIKFIERSSAT